MVPSRRSNCPIEESQRHDIWSCLTSFLPWKGWHLSAPAASLISRPWRSVTAPSKTRRLSDAILRVVLSRTCNFATAHGERRFYFRLGFAPGGGNSAWWTSSGICYYRRHWFAVVLIERWVGFNIQNSAWVDASGKTITSLALKECASRPLSLSAKTANFAKSILKHRVLIESAQMPEIKLKKCHGYYLSSLKTKLFYLLAIIRILLLFATKLLTLHNNSNTNIKSL